MFLRKNKTNYYEMVKDRLGFVEFNYNFYISLKNKYIYCQVAKAGCSTIKKQLIRNELDETGHTPEARNVWAHAPYHNSLMVKPFQVGPAMFNEIIRDKKFLKFIFVRNPYTRALSGYLDKVRKGENMVNNIIPHVDTQRGCDISDIDQSSISFIEFCRALEQKKVSLNSINTGMSKPNTLALILFRMTL